MPRTIYTKELLEPICASSYSYAEVLRKLGKKPGGGTQAGIKLKIQEFGIDISHFTGQGWNKNQKHDNYTPEELFKENSTLPRQIIRRYIIKHNYIPYECAECGNKGIWRGKEMSLELDHINGINNDHRLSNLRWLCPNCHAITETYCRTNMGLYQNLAYGPDLESGV